MRYLIDTHVFIWLLTDRKAISAKAADILKNPRNKCFISMVAFWEMATKIRIGKLVLNNLSLSDAKKYCRRLKLAILPVTFESILTYLNLPLFKNHRDLFDRMLIATAIERGFTLLSRDAKLPLYDGAGLLHLW